MRPDPTSGQRGPSRVLAIGIDAAEPTLVRKLIDRGELPALGRLLDRGRWALVDSRADIGSGAVWPTFFTGADPLEHGVYCGWMWEPAAMATTSELGGRPLTPFWTRICERERSVVALDVPFAPLASTGDSLEVSEWGAHDIAVGRMRVSSPRVREIVEATGTHPFTELPCLPGRLEDHGFRQRLSTACVTGARLRGELACRLLREADPDLAIVVFTEVHHVTHQLWHTVASDDRLYADPRFRAAEGVTPGLLEVYREVDRQVGRIVEQAGPDTAVVAFSLHGMRPGPGIPTVLEPLLGALGFTALTPWRERAWKERGIALFGAAKRHAPAGLKRLYQRALPHRARHRLARPTMVAPYDWSRTSAFSVPTDQHGYVRLNIAGREAEGIVPPEEYGATCDRLEDVLREVATPDGDRLVADVIRTAPDGDPMAATIPDLIVDWSEAAFAAPLAIAHGTIGLEAHPRRTDLTGRHSAHGFCVVDERLAEGIGESVPGAELHRLMAGGLESRTPATAS